MPRVPSPLCSSHTQAKGTKSILFLTYASQGYQVHFVPYIRMPRVPSPLCSSHTQAKGTKSTLFLTYASQGYQVHFVLYIRMPRVLSPLCSLHMHAKGTKSTLFLTYVRKKVALVPLASTDGVIISEIYFGQTVHRQMYDSIQY